MKSTQLMGGELSWRQRRNEIKKIFNPFHLVVIALAAWMNHRQYGLIDYLRAENRVLREQLGERPLRFSDDQRL